ncbi:sugar O-acetyltransferase [Cupriavidus sp. AU9028]|uniref:sugar O-acetyltransferase n=1 Tax=Cupriavidus sp. AU9028 TaxID=2871157 RepID=UPI002108116A|nr:sugar O-acetyltransferase [Cupriavidus sp. AU9028]
MQSGDLYIADDPQLHAEAREAYRLARDYAAQYGSDDDAARQTIERLLGAIAPDAHIKPPIYVDYGKYIRVGARTFINYGLVALDVAPITIGADVQIGPNVQLLTPTHPVDPAPRQQKWEAAEPIVIGDNVWLGGGVIVLPGVTIGANSVIGAGAVVTRDIPPNVIAVGNPARVMRRLDAPGAAETQTVQSAG